MDTGIFIGDKIITTSWDKIWNKPTTLSGYGITDAYTQSDADGRFFRYFGYTADSGDDFTWWQKLGTLAYLNAFPDGVTIKRHAFGQVTSFIAGSSTLQLYSTHSSSDPNDGPNGIQFRSGWNDDKKSWRMLLDEVNYLHYTDNRYVNKAGDTMTGNLHFSNNTKVYFNNNEKFSVGSNGIIGTYLQYDSNIITVTSSNPYYNSNKIWHAGNDGSGSGLDADLLDGYHYYSFESYHKVSIDTTGLDNNTWYPVTMHIDNSLQTRIRVQGNTYAPGSWNGRKDKRMSLILDYTVNGSSWGWTSARRVINEIQDGTGAQGAHCIGGLGQLTNSSTEYVYVRGGAVYDFYVDRFINPVLRTSTYTIENQSVSPQTSYSYVNRTNALLTDNVASATKLQTPRTIFSKPFDGTSNVTGGAKFNNICIETDNNGNDSGRSSEINNYVGPLQLQQASPNGIHMCMGGGQVGICTTSPKYTLHVDGVIYAKDGFRETSDIRKKKVLNSHTVSLDDMAYADLFDYTLIDDEKEIVRVGTNAHYWLDKLPQVVTKDNDEYLSLNYGVLGTVCALSVSKYVKQLEDRVTLLENKIASL